mmetsp:Transcript_22589/g.62814  ORF Transcript_22589/g.62814 Transcript_22589/m.62814 type:complete len:232 (-) Transcript_22589:243-938(-)
MEWRVTSVGGWRPRCQCGGLWFCHHRLFHPNGGRRGIRNRNLLRLVASIWLEERDVGWSFSCIRFGGRASVVGANGWSGFFIGRRKRHCHRGSTHKATRVGPRGRCRWNFGWSFVGGSGLFGRRRRRSNGRSAIGPFGWHWVGRRNLGSLQRLVQTTRQRGVGNDLRSGVGGEFCQRILARGGFGDIFKNIAGAGFHLPLWRHWRAVTSSAKSSGRWLGSSHASAVCARES